ncbi:uncharacterized protein LOC115588692 isoform X2 [Sparus aurata]|uniref:uncharacterized protein LOC115588692 isoform X2 n=1 Tax=Sparus aurata TaxID=8175 RepID=UPI0011C0D08E|nr:uncharacterized protein LOC115588692 isoform X2 [Sparus aurata]
MAGPSCQSLTSNGDEEMTITGNLEGSVLLPCNCLQRNLDEEFLWQREEPRTILVVKNTKNTSNYNSGYKDRAKLFLHENSNNCSILLTNITVDDQGRYRCKFYKKKTYMRVFVNLNINASYDVCQDDSADNLNANKSGKTFRCNASGHYGEAEIQWKLGGQLLTNSPDTNITHTNTLDDQTGLYQLTSKLITKLSGTPACDVKAKGLSIVIRDDCTTMTETLINPVDPMRYRYLKMIPIMLVVVFSVVLWRRGNSHRYQR